MAPLRGAVRASRLRRPRARQRLRGDPRERPLRQPGALPRPRRLADLQRLAATYNSLTHEQSYYRWLERAWRGGPAGLRQPLRREPGPLRPLPVQAELLQRDGQRPAPGEADPRAAGLHRRPVRRPGQGLVPDRPQPVPGAASDQRGQARGGAGHGGLRAVRLPLVPINGAPACDPKADRRAGSTDLDSSASGSWRSPTSSTTRSPAWRATAGPRGRSINGGNFLDHRQLLATWADCEDPRYHDHTPTAVSYPTTTTGRSATASTRCVPAGARRRSTEGPVCNTRGLTALGEHAIRPDHRARHDLRPRPHERPRPQPGPRPARVAATTPGWSPRTAGHRRRAAAGSTRSAVS